MTQLTNHVAANRRAVKWSKRALAGRALWEVLHVFFSWSPRPFWFWRNSLLRAFGARIGREVHIHPSVKIAVPWNLDIGDYVAIGDGAILYSLGVITIGPGACISQYAHICAGTHDYTRPDMPLLKPPVSIGAGAWICANAFIGPGVRVGEYAVAGAGAVVSRDLAPWGVYAGNPAVFLKQRALVARAEALHGETPAHANSEQSAA